MLFYFAICSFIFQLGSVFENAQQLQSLLKSLDKNGDGKITIDDIQLILQGLGLGSVSPSVY
jgi:Ca2+-binding EF-hand superfamily protein